MVEIRGNIIEETYENSELKDTLQAKIFDFLDTYDENIADMIKEHIRRGQ